MAMREESSIWAQNSRDFFQGPPLPMALVMDVACIKTIKSKSHIKKSTLVILCTLVSAPSFPSNGPPPSSSILPFLSPYSFLIPPPFSFSFLLPPFSFLLPPSLFFFLFIFLSSSYSSTSSFLLSLA